MIEVRYVFGRRQAQDLPGYASGPTRPFAFTVTREERPHTWYSAHVLLAFYREEFVKACVACGTSSALRPIDDREVWIPTGYLDRPTIEIIDGSATEELLLDGVQPNPWLSTATH